MSTKDLPILRQGPRSSEDERRMSNESELKDDDDEKTMSEVQVVEVPSEPVAVAVAWDGPNDPENPQNFTTSRKWWITIVCCVLTINSLVCVIFLLSRDTY